MVKDDVNFVNAKILAKERGLKVTETRIADTEEYINLITVKAISDDTVDEVSGTIFGKKNPRVVSINNFRLELAPRGRFLLIHNTDKPGAIGGIGTILGNYDINISRMRVGKEKGSDKTMIFVRTDSDIPDDVLAEIRALPLINTATVFEL